MQEIQADIIRQAASGDKEAFRSLYDVYADYVFNIALRMVRNREDAQEVTQEVFIAVFRKLKHFRFQASLKTWIYRITINMAINQTKKRAKNRDRTVEYDDTRTAATGNALEQTIDQEHRQKLIDKLLGFLTPEQRACVVLRNIEGLSYKQIAQTLNIDINAVRSRLKRSREKLLSQRKEVMAHEM